MVNEVREALGAYYGESILDAAKRVRRAAEDTGRLLAERNRHASDAQECRTRIEEARAKLGATPTETVEEAAKRVATERSEARAALSVLRDVNAAVRVTLRLPNGRSLLGAVQEVLRERDDHAAVLASLGDAGDIRQEARRLRSERDEARAHTERLAAERDRILEDNKKLGNDLLATHQALGGRAGFEHVTEAARRVVSERDQFSEAAAAARRDVAVANSTARGWENEYIAMQARLAALTRERDEARRDASSETATAIREVLGAHASERTLDAAKRLAERKEALFRRASDMYQALLWCSGAEDFQPGARAHDGFDKIVAPILAYGGPRPS